MDEVEEQEQVTDSKIAAVTRTEFGKGAARRTRRAGLVPAVLYGHGTDPVHLSLPGHEVQLALRVANAVLELSVDGGKTELALAKQAQRNPIKGNVEHLDLVIVKKGEKVTVEVPLHIVGDDKLGGGIVMTDMQSITLEVEATNIPAQVEVNVADFEVGRQLTVAELELPEGASYPGDADDLVLTISVVREESEEPAEGEAEAAPAEEADEA